MLLEEAYFALADHWAKNIQCYVIVSLETHLVLTSGRVIALLTAWFMNKLMLVLQCLYNYFFFYFILILMRPVRCSRFGESCYFMHAKSLSQVLVDILSWWLFIFGTSFTKIREIQALALPAELSEVTTCVIDANVLIDKLLLWAAEEFRERTKSQALYQCIMR